MTGWQPYLAVVSLFDPAAVTAVERRLGIALPADVLALICDHGGQAPEQDVVDLPCGGDTAFTPVLVMGLPASHDYHSYSVEFALDALRDWNAAAARHWLPFAGNSASGWFCADLATQPVRIVFVDTQYDASEDGAVSVVAPDLATLLAALHR